MAQILGIDIGGSGIKGAVVDIDSGELVSERHRVPTPSGAKPDDVAAALAGVVDEHGYEGPVGCTFPGVVRAGTVLTAANVHRSWKGTDAAALFAAATGLPVTVVNDADAAGLAEMRFGVGANQGGVVVVVTLGTGIGTAVFTDGRLVPNTELGHIEIDGADAETRAASRWREEENLSWKEWGGRVNWYLRHLELLVLARPDRDRRRGQPSPRPVLPVPAHAGTGGGGRAAQQRRHRGRSPVDTRAS